MVKFFIVEGIACLSLIVFIVTVLLLIRQLRIQTYQSVQQNLCTIDMYLIKYPELRKYINGNEQLPKQRNLEYDRVNGMIEMLLDFYEHVLEQYKYMSERRWESWKYNMKFVYDTCPGMRKHIQLYKRRYSPDLIAILEQGQNNANTRWYKRIFRRR